MNLVFSEVLYKGEGIGKRVHDGLLPAFAVVENYKIYNVETVLLYHFISLRKRE